MHLRHLAATVFLLCSLAACSGPAPVSTLTQPPTAPPTLTKTSLPPTATPTASKTARKITATFKPKKTSTPTARPTITLTPTATIHRTSTPQPKLISHTWELKQIVLRVEKGGGDGCCLYKNPPLLVLYGDGLLIKESSAAGKPVALARKLERREMCALLNTLDQVGFLDYDPSVYVDPMAGLGSTFITVNAWKEQRVNGQVLNRWIYEGGDWWRKECPESEGCAPPPLILPALSNAYKLLDHYDPGGLKKLPARQMMVWAIPEEPDTQPAPWPIKEISLETIARQAIESNLFMTVIDDPAAVRALETMNWSGYYAQGDVRRMVTIRPLWPAETHFGVWFPGLPTAAPVVPAGTTITCNPEDGVLPVP